MKTHLYFVHYNDGDSQYDLLVEAESIEFVTDIWREYYELDDDFEPDRISNFGGMCGSNRAYSWV